jgi:hypothetical protein
VPGGTTNEPHLSVLRLGLGLVAAAFLRIAPERELDSSCDAQICQRPSRSGEILRMLTSGPFLRPSLYVRTTFHEIQRLLAAEGVISRRDHPEIDTTVRYLVRRGDLARVLPGIYATTDRAASQQTRISALSRFDPDATLVGAVAARISFWPDLRVDVIECAVRHRRAPKLAIASHGGTFHQSWSSTGPTSATHRRR